MCKETNSPANLEYVKLEACTPKQDFFLSRPSLALTLAFLYQFSLFIGVHYHGNLETCRYQITIASPFLKDPWYPWAVFLCVSPVSSSNKYSFLATALFVTFSCRLQISLLLFYCSISMDMRSQ